MTETPGYHSQFGEDKIIEEIFEWLEPKNRWCFECGAHDGLWLSNTLRLRKQGWNAVLAESAMQPFLDMQKNCRHEHCYYGKVESIDKTLSQSPIPKYFDFMSLDVDGDDYWLWKDMEQYRAMVVCIEFSPYEDAWYYNESEPVPRGSGGQTSRKPTLQLADEKGYVLVGETYCNLIFVDSNVHVG